ncbi:hypothetical protein LMG19146_00296 [Xanthomonas arboricola pv. fragariae]|uniref:DUF1963 domain-containing protein n=1 Tax=Xanthomonas arboricola TaxID=56448 RepID=A0AAU9HMP7_9XANT|nr:hypothetical protein [Xanthomonas arboricola]SOT95753.1 hypothetical protein LMG19146_00296 [Xanthomonas arboricola pv. fragariae]NIK51778.1 hypothetical protein [Xanthomonas arboricola]NJB78700.1 hypothetical protein [Xanthomonas arboricola]CAE6696176.1 hypothetical protein XA1314C_03010 [Xanthomonas arboricola]CAE6696207.1 hypothetical protein XA1314C_03010 [Xanthomonas arboricola]
MQTRPGPGLHKIVVTDQDGGLGQFGGGAWLHDAALWPMDPSTGRPMLPIVMLTGLFLPTAYLPDDRVLTVFASIERSGGVDGRSSLRRLAVNQQGESDKLAQGHSKVLLHRRAAQEVCVGDSARLLGRHFIGLQPFDDHDMAEELEDEDSGAGMSKQLGRPCWLQDPIYMSPRYYFLAQFVEAELGRVDSGYAGLFGDGTGYLFADQRARKLGDGVAAGHFFIQFT